MPTYRVFGLTLDSELDFPGLPAAAGDEAGELLHVRHGRLAERMERAQLIGTDPEPPCDLRLTRHDAGFRLEHKCTGQFELQHASSTIVCEVHDATEHDALRLDVLGRMLPLAVHARGHLCLHASAVVIEKQAIALVAPKGVGKSTLAMALVESGAQLLTDDALAITLAHGALAMPGVARLRLRDDAVTSVVNVSRDRHLAFDGKLVVEPNADREIARQPAALAAIYVLAPAAGDRAQPVLRERLADRDALPLLMGHGKLGMLLGADEGFAVLERTIALLQRVPVYRLSVARELARVHEVADTIAQWHPTANMVTA